MFYIIHLNMKMYKDGIKGRIKEEHVWNETRVEYPTARIFRFQGFPSLLFFVFSLQLTSS